MKKIGLIALIIFLLTGCNNSKEETYDYVCKKTDTSTEEYKITTEIKFSFDSGKVYKFFSKITEEHLTDTSINNAYIKYQNLYDNYNENNVAAEYQKDGKKLIASFELDKSDIDKMKIELPYDFSLNQDKFIETLKNDNFQCK